MFDNNMAEKLKLINNPKEWMDNFLLKEKNKSTSKEIRSEIESRNNLKKFADFSCGKCGTLYVKDQAITNQGICSSCGGAIVSISELNIQEDYHKPSKNDEYECCNCGKKDTYSSILKNKKICISCEQKSFVKTSLMDSIVQNTIQINKSIESNFVDAEHEKGKVYAYYSYQGEDGPVNVVVMADGKFKENDFLHFDLNNGKPRAIVASMNKDPLIKFSVNDNISCTWVVDEKEVYEYNDVNNRKITKGAKLEWISKKGLYSGVVEDLNENGVVVDLKKHPEVRSSSKKELGKVAITQNYINKTKVCII